jgi:hypothetical protein
MNTSIPVRAVGVAAHAAREQAPYRAFIAAGLVLGIGGGFLLSILLPLARTLDWSWGADMRRSELAQVHGQLQLIGFGGLFVMGMGLRIMPRVSGRPVGFSSLVPTLIPLVGGYLVLRSVAQPMSDSGVRDVALVASSALHILGAGAFAAITWRTLLHRESKAEATGYFFALGALGFLAGAFINSVQTLDMVTDSLAIAPPARQAGLVFTQQFGFLLMFVAGVGSRAIPGLTGRARQQILPRVTAVTYAAGVATFATFMLFTAERQPSTALIRAGDAGLLLTGLSFLSLAWISGALLPGSNVARASRLHFWFVRAAFAWLIFAAILIFWYAGDAFIEGTIPDQFALDAIRHTLTVGVLTTIIVGISMLIVPEFAGRRLQHPHEGALHMAMLAGLLAASVLRVWPALEGIGWIEDSRYWPMAISGGLAAGVVVVFAAMFAQSWWQQREAGWSARAEALEHG